MRDQIGLTLHAGAGMPWKAPWAPIFSCIKSAVIQVVVSRQQMARTLGELSAGQARRAGLFGFNSSA